MSEGTGWQDYGSDASLGASDTLLVRDVSATPPSAGTVKQVTIAALFLALGYLLPSGDDTGVTDRTAINARLSAGLPVRLVPGAQYYIDEPITIPGSKAYLSGGWPYTAAQADAYSAAGGGEPGGTLITMIAGFTGAAGIVMANATDTQYYGVYLGGFMLDGEAVTSPTPQGIRCTGAWGACVAEGVMVQRPQSDCWYFAADATTGYVPDDWYFDKCKASASESATGFNLQNLPDSWFMGCESSESGTDQWVIGFCVNTRFVACKGENATAGAGFHLIGQGAGDTVELIGCTTSYNSHDGFLFDDTVSGGGGQGTYLLTGCRSSNDGQAGGTTYGGFRNSGNLSQVIGTGCVTVANGTGPAYGAAQTDSSYYMTFTGSELNGLTADAYDDLSAYPLTSQLPAVPTEQLVTLTAATAFTSTNPSTTTQNVTYLNAYLNPGTYQLKAWLPCTSAGTDGSTQTFAWTFGGTMSSAFVKWASVVSGATSAFKTGTSITTATAALTMSSSGIWLEFEGLVTVTAAGSLQLTVKGGTAADLVTVPAGAYLSVVTAP